MKMNIYTIYDVASGAHLRPLFCQADGEAMRVFSDHALDAENPIGKHPEDYTLIRIGHWDDNTAEIFPEKHTKLLTGLAVVSQSRQIEPAQLKEADNG